MNLHTRAPLSALCAMAVLLFACQTEPPPGKLNVWTEPDGAMVYANGDCVSTTPNTAYLAPGVYELRIERAGYEPFDTTVTIVSDQFTDLPMVTLEPGPMLRAMMEEEEPHEMRVDEPVEWTDVWTTLADAPTARSGGASAVFDKKLYVLGGYGYTEEGWTYFGTVERYAPSTDSWIEMYSRMPTPRASAAAAAGGPEIYVMGGTNQEGVANTVEAFDTINDSWRPIAPMPTARQGLVAAAIGPKIYAIGGFDGQSFTGVVECYNVTTEAWTTLAEMPTPRVAAAVAVLWGKIYVVGGNADGFLAVAERYDPETDTWTRLPEMPTPRMACVAGAIGDAVFVGGGFNDHEPGPEHVPRDAFEAFLPAEDRWAGILEPMPTPRTEATAPGYRR